MAYEAFASVYDLFNEEADYDALAKAVLARLHTAGVTQGIVADLGCGTGELTLRLAEKGYDMIAIDLSPDMLSTLREKAEDASLSNILLLNQDIAQLDLYGTVRAIVSTFDTFNHIGPLAQLQQAIVRAALFLEPGGVFLFDMNTPYKHQEILANNTFEIEIEDGVCTWKNTYDALRCCTHISVQVSDDEGELFCEQFEEYCYTLEQIEPICSAAGLVIQEVCDGESFGALTPHSERFLFTAIKL